MGGNDDYPQHTLIDTDLVPEPAEQDDKTSVALPPQAGRPAPKPAYAEDDDEEPARTVLIESPFATDVQVSPAPEARLVVDFGNDRGKEFNLPTHLVVVGRALDCGIVLNDAAVSRRHFQIDFADGRWILRDLGSGNGTKVGGQKVSEIFLENGMQIEVGQTLLTYACTGGESQEEKTRALDVSALPAEEEEDDSMKTVVRPALIEPMLVKPPPRITVAEAPPQPVRRTGTLPLVIAGVVGLLILGVCVAQFGLGIRILPIGDGGKVQEAAPVADLKGEAADAQARGLKAIAARQWDQAIGLMGEAKEKDPSLAGVDEALARAQDEKRNAAFLAAAKVSLEKGQPTEALAVLGRVQDTSVYFADARKLVASLSDQEVGKEIEKVRELLGSRKKADAKQAYVALVESHPEDPRVAGLRDELVAAGIAVDPPRPVVVAAVQPAPGDPAVQPQPIAPAPQPVPQPLPSGKGGKGRPDYDRALAQYNAGNFESASADLRAAAERAKGDDATRARDLAGKIDRFAAAFSQGKTGLQSKRLDQAEAGLTQALRFDHDVNGHFDGEIRGLLADTYRSRAALAMQNADYVQAAKSARRALSFRAEDGLAKGILDKCMAVAQSWYDQAAADAQAGRKDAARQKARLILDIVPAGHPLAEKAAEMMR